MRGLTRLEVELLKDAAAIAGYNVEWSPAVNDAVLSLAQRRLVILEETYRQQAWGGFSVEVQGVITPLGRLVLSLVLTEPSLIAP